MARFDTSGLDNLVREMQRMGQMTGQLAETMVNAAVIEIRDSWRESAEKHDLIDTGAMIESIGFPEPARTVGDVIFRDVYPTGKDKHGTRNAEKAFILNYGSSRIKPTHWVEEAEANCGPRVQSKLEDILDQYNQSGGVVPPVVDNGGLIHHN